MIFVDMDGTLARFYQDRFCTYNYSTPGFFLKLRPYENMVGALRQLFDENYSIRILSAADEDARDDKRKWLDHYLNRKIPASFVPVGENKGAYIARQFGLSNLRGAILIDDYSRNCIEWEASNPGARAIKFLNEVNGRGWNGYNFSGPCISYLDSPQQIADALKRFLKEM